MLGNRALRLGGHRSVADAGRRRRAGDRRAWPAEERNRLARRSSNVGVDGRRRETRPRRRRHVTVTELSDTQRTAATESGRKSRRKPALADAINVYDVREKARWLPRSVFDAIDGGAGEEVTLRAN